MQEEKLGKLLGELAEQTVEPVRPGLAEDIKSQIPQRLTLYKGGMDTINIIINLRINKLAAAAAIIITIILCANFRDVRNSTGDSIYQNSKMLVKYFLKGGSADESDMLERMLKLYYEIQDNMEATYYGDNIDLKDSNAVLMQWKLPDGKYRVIFGDLRTKIVDADELIKLQAQMLQKKAK